jgi:hypothetical protein
MQLPTSRTDGGFEKLQEFWNNQRDLVSSEVGLKGRLLEDLEKAAADLLRREKETKSSQTFNAALPISSSTTEINATASSSTAKNNTRSTPGSRLIEIESIELVGRWEEREGNFVLRPVAGIDTIGVIHFIGGAFVGAAPHLTYRYLLESLCDAGYIVVATPYKLGTPQLDVETIPPTKYLDCTKFNYLQNLTI